MNTEIMTLSSVTKMLKPRRPFAAVTYNGTVEM